MGQFADFRFADQILLAGFALKWRKGTKQFKINFWFWNLRINPINSGFAIFGLANLRNLRVCDSGMSPGIDGPQELQRKLPGTIKWPSKNENLEKPKRNSLWYRDENMKQKVQIPEKTYRDRIYGDVSSRHHGGRGRGVSWHNPCDVREWLMLISTKKYRRTVASYTRMNNVNTSKDKSRLIYYT